MRTLEDILKRYGREGWRIVNPDGQPHKEKQTVTDPDTGKSSEQTVETGNRVIEIVGPNGERDTIVVKMTVGDPNRGGVGNTVSYEPIRGPEKAPPKETAAEATAENKPQNGQTRIRVEGGRAIRERYQNGVWSAMQNEDGSLQVASLEPGEKNLPAGAKTQKIEAGRVVTYTANGDGTFSIAVGEKIEPDKPGAPNFQVQKNPDGSSSVLRWDEGKQQFVPTGLTSAAPDPTATMTPGQRAKDRLAELEAHLASETLPERNRIELETAAAGLRAATIRADAAEQELASAASPEEARRKRGLDIQKLEQALKQAEDADARARAQEEREAELHPGRVKHQEVQTAATEAGTRRTEADIKRTEEQTAKDRQGRWYGVEDRIKRIRQQFTKPDGTFDREGADAAWQQEITDLVTGTTLGERSEAAEARRIQRERLAAENSRGMFNQMADMNRYAPPGSDAMADAWLASQRIMNRQMQEAAGAGMSEQDRQAMAMIQRLTGGGFEQGSRSFMGANPAAQPDPGAPAGASPAAAPAPAPAPPGPTTTRSGMIEVETRPDGTTVTRNYGQNANPIQGVTPEMQAATAVPYVSPFSVRQGAQQAIDANQGAPAQEAVARWAQQDRPATMEDWVRIFGDVAAPDALRQAMGGAAAAPSIGLGGGIQP